MSPRLDDARNRLTLQNAADRAASAASAVLSHLYQHRSSAFIAHTDSRFVARGRGVYRAELLDARRQLDAARASLAELEAGIEVAEGELAAMDAGPGPRAA